MKEWSNQNMIKFPNRVNSTGIVKMKLHGVSKFLSACKWGILMKTSHVAKQRFSIGTVQ